MALDYGNVKDMYDTLKSSGVTTKPLPEWSQEMNDLTGTELYSAGLHDNIIKRASHGIDKLLEATTIPGYTEQFGRKVGELVGAPEAGAAVGHGLPRLVVNFLPLRIPGAGGPIAAGARLGLTGALTGAEAYEKTDSPLSALISGATAAALPAVASKTSGAIGQLIGKSIGSPFFPGGPIADLEGNIVKKLAAQYIPETFGQKVLQKGGGEFAGQVAAAGVMGVTQPIEQVARGEEVTSPFTTENLLGLTLGQAPFAALHLGGKLLGAKPKAMSVDELQKAVNLSDAAIKLKTARKDLENKSNLEDLPDKERPQGEELTVEQYALAAKTRQTLSKIRGDMIAIKDDPTLTDEQKVNKTNDELNREFALLKERDAELADKNTIFGNKINEDDPRTELYGKQLAVSKDGTWRAIHVLDDPQNPEELRGMVVSNKTYGEAPPKFGLGWLNNREATWSMPHRQWWKIRTKEEWDTGGRKGKAIVDPNLEPQLPTREEPMF